MKSLPMISNTMITQNDENRNNTFNRRHHISYSILTIPKLFVLIISSVLIHNAIGIKHSQQQSTTLHGFVSNERSRKSNHSTQLLLHRGGSSATKIPKKATSSSKIDGVIKRKSNNSNSNKEIRRQKDIDIANNKKGDVAVLTSNSNKSKIQLKTSNAKDFKIANKKQRQDGVVKSKKEVIRQEQSQQEHPREDTRIMFLMRLLFLTYYGSLGSLLPYLPVYYDSIGHGGQVIGFLGAVKPLTTFLVAPAWGILSDQTQKPFFILQVTFLVSLLGQILVSLRHDTIFLTIMVFVTALFNAPVKSLLDTMVMDQLHDPSASYGKLRLWGQLGFGLGGSSAGMLLSRSTNRNVEWNDVIARSWVYEMSSSLPKIAIVILENLDRFWQTITGYKLLFLVHAALSIPTWILIQVFHRTNKDKLNKQNIANLKKSIITKKINKASKKSAVATVSVMEGLKLLITNNDAMLFFFLVFVVGISSGVIENFAYVRIREVGGTGKEMGLSRLVSSIAGAPMFWFSGPLTEALGADRVLILSLFSYVIRFVIYATMKNPYQGLPAEALRGITFAAFWSTGTVYAHRVAPSGMQATMLMFLNAMYGGLGQSLGAIIGGRLQYKVGTVRTFYYAAIFDLCFVILVVSYLSLSPEGNSSFKNPKPIEAKVAVPMSLSDSNMKNNNSKKQKR